MADKRFREVNNGAFRMEASLRTRSARGGNISFEEANYGG
jgi:hypothetical protein